MAMTDDEIKAIAERMAEVLSESKRAQWVDAETHHNHHQWAAARIAREETWSRRKEKVMQTWAGGISVAATLGLVAWMGWAALRWLTDMLGRGN